jgi:hypothetical protein
MVRAWSPAQVHEVWAPLALRLPQVHAAGHEVRAQAPRARAREPLCVLLAHEAAGAHAPLAQEVEAQVPHAQEDEAEARAPLAQAHEAEAQACARTGAIAAAGASAGEGAARGAACAGALLGGGALGNPSCS